MRRRLCMETCEPRNLLAVNLVADLNTNPLGSSPRFIDLGGTHFVSTAHGTTYQTDGTLAGTVEADFSADGAVQTSLGIFYSRQRTEVLDGETLLYFELWFKKDLASEGH